ncbi:hypothetical protein [uncultured Thiodictyon sp.]|uniref:hypothetical protein n=1 Tax=uncultured Thiodictyon sp. TaxID=1846217 RepID=UPI0025DCAD26|nr:hypothetical protein [uncultured Thiodictyon sp.]
MTGLAAQINEGKLEVCLQGRDLKESAKKTAAGEEAKTGVAISPAIAGRWVYGASAAGPDLIFTLGENERELKILHDGALLSLSGSKKLGVAVRGVDQVQVVLQRVLPHNMHHFAQFTRGDFQNPSFKIPIAHFAEKFTSPRCWA